MQPSADNSAAPLPAEPVVKVWDFGVRVFHWLLVVAVLVAAGTGFLAPRNWLTIHLIAGASIAALVSFRLIWGWTGSTYARFQSFFFTPRAVFARLQEVFSGHEQRYLGHNPLGAVMVFALLSVLIALVATGLVTLGGADKQGPLAWITSFTTGNSTKEVHQAFAWGLLALIAGHLAGVLFETVRSKDNLVRSLVTGTKTDSSASVTSPPVLARRWLAGGLTLAFAAIALGGTYALARLPGLGVPTEKMDAAYVAECGSCHNAYHPSLASTATWTAVMANLKDHFGENAELDKANAARIEAYLIANSADHWDTRAAHLLQVTNADQPLRLTSTPGWQRMHHSIPATVFASKTVGMKGACGSCHSDAATGRFDPQAISIPQETSQ